MFSREIASSVAEPYVEALVEQLQRKSFFTSEAVLVFLCQGLYDLAHFIKPLLLRNHSETIMDLGDGVLLIRRCYSRLGFLQFDITKRFLTFTVIVIFIIAERYASWCVVQVIRRS